MLVIRSSSKNTKVINEFSMFLKTLGDIDRECKGDTYIWKLCHCGSVAVSNAEMAKAIFMKAYAMGLGLTDIAIDGYLNKSHELKTGDDVWFPDSVDSVDSCEKVLKKLVHLKDHKDLFGKDEWYKENQPKAWEEARKAIAENR